MNRGLRTAALALPLAALAGCMLARGGSDDGGTRDGGQGPDASTEPSSDGGTARDAAVSNDAGAVEKGDAGPIATSDAGGGGGGDGLEPWHNVQIVGGGFIPGIVFNPKQKGLAYVRTDIGGAYRLDPGNGRWIPLLDWVAFDDWNVTGVESIATDPVDPNRLYIAAGTYTNDWTSMNGAILRSTDQGRTFSRTNLPFKLGGNMPGRSMGERLVVDPNDPRVLFLGTRSGHGLWRSADSGTTWSQVQSFTATGTWADSYFQDPVGVVWIAFDPQTGSAGSPTRTLYVGVADAQTSLYRSTDGGASWEALGGQPAAGYLPHHGVLAPSGVLFVTYSDTAGPYDGGKGQVWKYDTHASTWTDISPVPSASSDDYFGYGGLAVDALHPDTLMVSTLNSWWPDAILFRSIDAGATWTRIWDWNGYPSRSLRYTQDISAAPWLDWGKSASPPVPSPGLGWMIGAMAIDPFDSDRMLYGTGATLYGTDNLTAWDQGKAVAITVKAKGIEETSIGALVSPPQGAQLWSGIGDLGGFRHDDVTAVPARLFTTPTFSMSTSLDFAELSPNFVVRVGNVASGDTVNKNIGLSWDGGANWYQPGSQPSLSGGGAVAVAANPSRIVWSPTGGPVSYSDGGDSWKPSVGIAAEAKVGSDRVNATKFYGFSKGIFYSSTDGGATFTASAAAGLPSAWAQFKAMPGVEGELWLAGGSSGQAYGLWHSTDSGASFTRLPNVQEADTIGFGKAAPGQSSMALYTSAKIDGVRGIFRSDDRGASWVVLTDEHHQFASTNQAITGDPRIFGRVYVGTNGRGILYRDAAP